MSIKIYQLDAFTDKLFNGNPAAVCPLESWLPDELMQQIALENNLAETAFYVKKNDHFHIRWFTPAVEVDLCGHATLATAHVIFNIEHYPKDQIEFESRSGILKVSKHGDYLTLDFPEDRIEKVKAENKFYECFDAEPSEIYKGKSDYMFVFNNETQIKNIKINLDRIAQLDARGVIITSKGDTVDFVSRFFAPQSGINEDPVTGSAHTTLAPYWKNILQKSEMHARQLSERQGYLICSCINDRVLIKGKVKLFMDGEIHLSPQN